MNTNIYFYEDLKQSVKVKPEVKEVLEKIDSYANEMHKNIYVTHVPLLKKQELEEDERFAVVLLKGVKILFVKVDKSASNADFEYFQEDVLESISQVANLHEFSKNLGRIRDMKNLCASIEIEAFKDVVSVINEFKYTDELAMRKGEIFLSLYIGSINDSSKVGEGVPDGLLEKIKRNVMLFDSVQTEFIFSDNKNKKMVNIQGLAGTGKTELLLRKLVKLYQDEKSPKLAFVCHNKVLASSLKQRIPVFFDFMKVPEQIKWNDRLFVAHTWGSRDYVYSGMYSFICNTYSIPFYNFKQCPNFEDACALSLKSLQSKIDNIKPAFDYIFVDEGQDMAESFIELCKIICKDVIYIAGDIFQDIFSSNSTIEADYLLSTCYRTDPKTLMFAHSFTMGLMETRKFGWLSDQDWVKCGYKITKNASEVSLTRQPIQRFEDLDEEYDSVVISNSASDYQELSTNIIETIKDIKEKNPTVQPNDIAVIFLSSGSRLIKNSYIAEAGEHISWKIKQEFKWESNLAITSKQVETDSVFISNQNNVKGLEFPFVICVTTGLENSKRYRNSLYMALTRSFITSYLLLLDLDDQTVSAYRAVFDFIDKNDKIVTNEPTDEEKKMITRKLNITDNLDVNKEYMKFLEEIQNDLDDNSFDVVKTNLNFYVEKNYDRLEGYTEKRFQMELKSVIKNSLNVFGIEYEFSDEDEEI